MDQESELSTQTRVEGPVAGQCEGDNKVGTFCRPIILVIGRRTTQAPVSHSPRKGQRQM